MSNRKTAIIIRVPDEMHDGLKGLAAQCGESAGVVVRTLLRQAIAQGRVNGLPPSGNESIRPMSRLDK